MENVIRLQQARTKPDLAELIGIPASVLTHTLYVARPERFYVQFKINKKSGGNRLISAPTGNLKEIQDKLARFLGDCLAELEKAGRVNSNVSHGFVKGKSIVTNAEKHRNSKNVLNVDIVDFFPSIHFGRVRGFFIKNKNFKLCEEVATTIAHIACFDKKLPQGAPTSPLISNLVCESLDARMIYLAKKYGCTYTRYADDITISTRKKRMPGFFVSDDLEHRHTTSLIFDTEIIKYGFSINRKKTRVQYKDSRQEVTGLVVNKKIGVKREYFKEVRAKCHSLFKKGFYEDVINGVKTVGSLRKLEGQLNFIDQVDRYNRMAYIRPKNKFFEEKKVAELNSREEVFAKFLFYKNFYANDVPVILTEGKTDIVYLREAFRAEKSRFPIFYDFDASREKEVCNFRFIDRSYNKNAHGSFKRMRFFFNLGEGTPGLTKFLNVAINRFNKDGYCSHKKENPVIFVLDNDSGSNPFLKSICDNKLLSEFIGSNFNGSNFNKDVLRKHLGCIYIGYGFYLVLTPRSKLGEDTMMEDFFTKLTLSKKVGKKHFDKSKDASTETTYGKSIFASKIVAANRGSVSFSKFRPILQRIVACINDYDDRRRKGTA